MTTSFRVPRLAAVILLAVAGSLGSGVTPASAAATCRSGLAGDVNGDGHAEVAVGGDYPAGGDVHVFYGRSSGLVADRSGTALDDQVFSQATSGIPGVQQAYDEFGAATAFGDLNGDGCADLAVGAPSDALEGTVTVLYGSRSGLTTRGAEQFTSAGVLGGTERGYESFGRALVTGDFDDDGLADLAVAASGKAPEGDVGTVAVLFGASGGLGHGRASEVLSAAAAGSGARALAAGDFDGDGRVELAVGTQEAVTTVERGAGGLAAATPRVLTESALGVPDANVYDEFASTLAAGDVNGDGRDELAVGVPNQECGEDEPPAGSCGIGTVVVLAGSPGGLTTGGRQLWTQDSPGMGGTARAGDGFGATVVMGRFDRGPYADLAIATPQDSVDDVADAGTVTVLYGSASGLTTAGAGGTRLSQDTAGIAGAKAPGDRFGDTLTAARVQTSGRDNLVVGVPYKKVGSVPNAGLVHQLAGSASGPRGRGSRTLHLARPGVKGTPTVAGLFGLSLNRS